MTTIRERLGIAVAALLAASAIVRAQQGGAPPASTPPGAPQTAAGSAVPPPQEPPPAPPRDTSPLGGVQAAVALAAGERSYLLTTFSIAQDGDTNAQFSPQGSGLEEVTIPVAHVSLNRVLTRGQFVADYLGGALIYDSQSSLNGIFQQFGFSQEFKLRRWDVLLTDRASYLPQSPFGFSGVDLIGSVGSGWQSGLGAGLNPLNSSFAPSQSVFTGQFGRFMDVGAAQVQYWVTPRTSVFATGAFTTMQFGNQTTSLASQPLLSGNNLIGTAGVDHLVTSKDTLSLVYTHSQFNFVGFPETVYSNFVQAGYGRRITGRLALALFGGPELTTVRQLGVNLQRQLLAAGQGHLDYQLPRTGLSLTYLVGATPGSGVLAGAETSEITGSLSRQLTRTWTGSLSLGYAHNTALEPNNLGVKNSYNSEFGGLRLDRNWGRSTKVFFMYNVERETANSVLCAGTACGRQFMRQIFGVGLSYSARPIGL